MATTLSGCASTSADPATIDRMHTHRAEFYEQEAEDFRGFGNRSMADYYDQEARRAHHNRRAARCGFFDVLLFDVLLGLDSCSKKGPF